ncbi:MAG: hypothetical protein R3250_06250, partial [Melioribacteraceae bacterium]|nr:hypothetical protein [Melioribacteraceae bacterium]
EHPVTEMISSVDLVEQQIKIASGEKLKINQEDLSISGHAIELRVYAEDSYNDFIPSIGKITEYKIPSGKGIRVDSGFRKGMEVKIFYDPMLSKLAVHADTRQAAIQLMREAISMYKINGVQTTLPFGDFVMSHPAFIRGDFDTHFVNNYFTKESHSKSNHNERIVSSYLAAQLMERHKQGLILHENKNDSWKENRKLYS